MSEHPKAVQAMMLANASVLVVNSENLHVLREGLLAMHKDFKQLLREQAATAIRHAEEMRELKERFSEAAEKALYQMRANQLMQAHVSPILAPFIIAAPDPLAEALKEADAPAIGKDGYDAMAERTRAAMQARGYEWRKIGEAGE